MPSQEAGRTLTLYFPWEQWHEFTFHTNIVECNYCEKRESTVHLLHLLSHSFCKWGVWGMLNSILCLRVQRQMSAKPCSSEEPGSSPSMGDGRQSSVHGGCGIEVLFSSWLLAPLLSASRGHQHIFAMWPTHSMELTSSGRQENLLL